MEHNRESHSQYMSEICWTCGQLTLRKKDKKQYKKTYNCKDLCGDILSVFGIDVTKDSRESHSQFMCHKCKAKIATWNRRKSLSCLQSARDVASSSSSLWCDFDEQKSKSISGCSICAHRLFVLAKGVAG